MAGRGVDLKNEEEVREYLENLGIEYRFGCYHEKNPKSCHLLGDYLEAIKQDFAKAFKIYDTNCTTYKHGHSCHKVAFYKMTGRVCDRDMDGAYDYYQMGCDRGYPRSCLHAGVLDTLPPGVPITVTDKDPGMKREGVPDPKKAAENFEKACQADIGDACHRLANLYIKGFKDAVQQNYFRAFPYALKACELGSLESCINVSIMYKKGDGVKQDLKQSEAFESIARDMMKQMNESKERISFQEGVESAG